MAACPYNDLTEQNNNDEEEDKDNKDKEEEEEDNVPIMTSQQNNSTEIPQTFLLCKEKKLELRVERRGNIWQFSSVIWLLGSKGMS